MRASIEFSERDTKTHPPHALADFHIERGDPVARHFVLWLQMMHNAANKILTTVSPCAATPPAPRKRDVELLRVATGTTSPGFSWLLVDDVVSVAQ